MKRNKLQKYFELLQQYVAFRTVSLPGHQDPEQIEKCLKFLEKLFASVPGFTFERWKSEDLNPIVFASYVQDPALPTVLVYGHYDVVAAGTGWKKTQPFELKWDKKADKFFGRGSTDNKGQNLIHALTVIELIKTGKLACNVKFFIEGNEETGSAGIENVIQKHAKKLAADYILVSDGEMAKDTPVIELSLRGLVNIRVQVETSIKDLHSGIAGGAVHNSVVVASQLISSIFRNDGHVNIPDFYKGYNMELATKTEVVENNKKLSSLIKWKKNFGVRMLKELGNDLVTSTCLMPTIEPMGIIAGGAENGFKHIIPGQTTFALNCRLIGNQDPYEVAELVMSHISKHSPKYARLEMFATSHHSPIEIQLETSTVAHVNKLLKKAYDKEPLFSFVGGGIPIVGHFKSLLPNAKILLVPLSTNDCNMHGADENMRTDLVLKGLKFSSLFFSKPLPAKTGRKEHQIFLNANG